LKLNYRLAWLLLASWLIQATIVPHIAIRTAKPDLILIVVATYAFLEGPAAGSIIGFFGGLLKDLITLGGVGINILTMTIVGYLAGLFERNLFGSKSALAMITMFVVSVFSQLLYALASFIFGEPIDLWMSIRYVILPSAVYTSLITLFIFSILIKILSHQREDTVFK